jgi:hypothetical protein
VNGWVKGLAATVVVTGLLSLVACDTRMRVKTHPAPETRIRAMRDALQSLPSDQDGATEQRRDMNNRKKEK